jgi:hypothetical protein
MLRSLFRYIHRQPKIIRTQYAFALASVFTGVVALVWISAQAERGFLDTTVTPIIQESRAPFSNLIKQAKEQLSAVREAVGETKEVVDNTAATTSVKAQDLVLDPGTIEETKARQNDSSGTTTESVGPPPSTLPVGREIQIMTVKAATTTVAGESE